MCCFPIFPHLGLACWRARQEGFVLCRGLVGGPGAASDAGLGVPMGALPPISGTETQVLTVHRFHAAANRFPAVLRHLLL